MCVCEDKCYCTVYTRTSNNSPFLTTLTSYRVPQEPSNKPISVEEPFPRYRRHGEGKVCPTTTQFTTKLMR